MHFFLFRVDPHMHEQHNKLKWLFLFSFWVLFVLSIIFNFDNKKEVISVWQSNVYLHQFEITLSGHHAKMLVSGLPRNRLIFFSAMTYTFLWNFRKCHSCHRTISAIPESHTVFCVDPEMPGGLAWKHGPCVFGSLCHPDTAQPCHNTKKSFQKVIWQNAHPFYYHANDAN